jgi:hypothetical protein
MTVEVPAKAKAGTCGSTPEAEDIMGRIFDARSKKSDSCSIRYELRVTEGVCPHIAENVRTHLLPLHLLSLHLLPLHLLPLHLLPLHLLPLHLLPLHLLSYCMCTD